MELDLETRHEEDEEVMPVRRQRSSNLATPPDWLFRRAKEFSEKLTVTDWAIYGGTALLLGFIAIQSLKPGETILNREKAAPAFDAKMALDGSDSSYRQWMNNFKLFIEDQQTTATIRQADRYAAFAAKYADDKTNDGCFGKTENECFATFLDNRKAELKKLMETSGDSVTVKLTKDEYAAVILGRTEAVLTAVENKTLPRSQFELNLAAVQVEKTADYIRNKAGVSAEVQAQKIRAEAEREARQR